MLPIFSGRLDNSFSLNKCKIVLISSALTLLTLAGCSNINLKTKDPELIALQHFTKRVTAHLFELNPSSYAEFQKSLDKEIDPNVLSQLKKQGLCANSKDQIQKNIQLMDKTHKRCLIRIDSTSFPSRATAQGLIPIEVEGICVKSLNDLSKASKFDVLYLVGRRVGTKEPMIASVEIKKFD
jgi:hypothetical protein